MYFALNILAGCTTIVPSFWPKDPHQSCNVWLFTFLCFSLSMLLRTRVFSRKMRIVLCVREAIRIIKRRMCRRRYHVFFIMHNVLKFYLLRPFNKMDVAGRAGGWWNLEKFCAGRFVYIIGGLTRLEFYQTWLGKLRWRKFDISNLWFLRFKT